MTMLLAAPLAQGKTLPQLASNTTWLATPWVLASSTNSSPFSTEAAIPAMVPSFGNRPE